MYELTLDHITRELALLLLVKILVSRVQQSTTLTYCVFVVISWNRLHTVSKLSFV